MWKGIGTVAVLAAAGFGVFWFSNTGSLVFPGESVAQSPSADPQRASASQPADPDHQGGQSTAASADPSLPNPAATAGPLPEPIPEAIPASSQERALWEVPGTDADVVVDGIPAKKVQVDPRTLATLQVGQTLELPLPHLNRTVEAQLASTHNQFNNVAVFKGPVSGGHEKDNIIVTRGKSATHIVVATRQGTFSAVVDNATGEGALTDEGDIHARTHTGDDSMTEVGIQMPTPGNNQ